MNNITKDVTARDVLVSALENRALVKLKDNAKLKMKKIRFYSKQEIKKLKDALECGIKKSDISKKYAKEFRRTEAAITNKLIQIENKEKRKALSENVPKAGVNLSDELRFSVTPKKVVLYNDRFEVFF